MYNGTSEPYVDPVAPVHFVTGSSVRFYNFFLGPSFPKSIWGWQGCQEDTDGFILKTPPWSAFRSSDYGFSRLTAHNASHLHWEQVSDDHVSSGWRGLSP